MNRHHKVALVAVLAGSGLAACADPLGGSKGLEIASISALSIPYPTVVLGDVMRDSLGIAAPVAIHAYDAKGNEIVGLYPQITILDATLNLAASTIHIDEQGFVHGVIRDSVGARVYAGFGSLVAPAQRVLVSVAPQVATKSVAATAISFDIATPDTSAVANWSPPLELTLTNTATAVIAAQGFVITYAVTRSPTPTTAGVPTAYIGDDAGKASRRDTTDRLGVAGRRVILRQQAIGDAALIAGTKTDTIVVRATVKYNGVELSGTPFDYIISVKRKP